MSTVPTCDQPAAAQRHATAERATTYVLILTLLTMVAEIVAGWRTGSMALLADGWHMGMHAAAMGVAVFAYRFANRHRGSGRFAFGAGKAGDLGAFANAVLLGVVALLVAFESVERLFTPAPIAFQPALIVAAIGLAVNLVSAWLLRDQPHDHGHDHAHAHAHAHAHDQAHGHAHDHKHEAGRDHNREAAFIHVLSDALTSVLAIVALWCGQRFGLVWMDPATAILGAVVILRWAVSLMRSSGAVLLDAAPGAATLESIRQIAADHGDTVSDLHVWPISAGRFAAAMRVRGGAGDYRDRLLALSGIVHLTFERDVAPAGPAPDGPDRGHHHH